MSKNLKNKINRMNLILVCSAILLTSCSKKQEEKEKSSTKNFEFVEKETNYKKDETTEVLIDAEIKKSDIVRSYKHGDHWHVFTKDGKEHITYTDPSKLGDGNSLSLVSVVSKSKLRGLNVTSILKHGDHWHVYTADGNEYLTYENPSSMFPNITVGNYVGSHSSNRNRGSSNNYSHANIIEEKKDRVVKILRHGDHWHIYTESGKEYISYTDPTSKYPNVEVGEYKGNHGDSQESPENEKPNVPSASGNLLEARKNLNIINVLGKNAVDRYDIVKILKHGDHYHIYDSKGNEGITYTNPKSLYPYAEFGEYQGNHGDDSNNHSHDNIIEEKKDRVIKILRHGDHWHIYTESGKEYISYTDPTSKYPNVEVGEYKGNHGDSQESPENEKPNVPSASGNLLEARKNLNIINVLGKNAVDRYDIVKILKHGDHYHIYDSKGNEGITYTNPKSLYPDAEFGEYQGNHRDGNEKPFEWPKGVTRIVDHGDHWHLYVGDKEVAVVHENPRSHYPNAEYIKEGSDHSDIGVDENELFTYESVKAEIKDKVIPYLDNNLRAMRHYGDLNTTLPVYGSNGVTKGIFYWLHGNHYHAITIKQIIQNAKAGQYGDCTAKEIVSALKYIIENPNAKIESKITVDREEVEKYLMKVYNLKDKLDVQVIGNIAYVYINNETLTFSLADFEKVNGEIRYKKELPKAPKKVDKDNKNSDVEKEDNNKNTISKSEDKKVDEKKKEKLNTNKSTKLDENKKEKDNKKK